MHRLTTPVSELPGVGPKTAAKLNRLGIRTAADLLSHFPIRHEDLRHVTPITKLRVGQTAVVRGRVQLIANRRTFRRRLTITEALVSDETGSVRVVWFNQPYLATTYPAGSTLFLVGQLTPTAYGLQFQSPIVERVKARQLLAGRLLPVYRATSGLTQRQLRDLIETALPATQSIPDWLPTNVRSSQRFPELRTAVHEIHFPSSPSRLNQARERLKFNEVFLFILAVLQEERERHLRRAQPIPFDEAGTRTFVRSLPFRLTDDQRRAAWDALRDLGQPQPMNRLLEGDVGSGKTVVAAIAARNAAIRGIQTALLAPTDILARQHFATFNKLLGSSIPVGILTRTQHETSDAANCTKRVSHRRLKDGSLPIVVGTHALLGQDVSFSRLGFIVIDEQHRFGVAQRHALLRGNDQFQPHLLSMTATPIPRTLALTLFGHLKLSTLRQLPPGRTPIATSVIGITRRHEAFRHARARAAVGEQTYVVCPFIEESDELGVAAATEEFERLQREDLTGLHLALLHGKLPASQQHRVLEAFARGAVDVLVTTPVVEVGVDIPNVTTMVIESAERFGLAQLHQLRGRVGRGTKPSTCFLLPDGDAPESLGRLEAVAATQDGFALAEEDLRRRGPGEVYGLRQSGLPAFTMASLTDLPLMRRAHDLAQRLLADDPELEKLPLLRRRVAATARLHHRE